MNQLVALLAFAAIMAVFMIADARHRRRNPIRPPVRTEKASPFTKATVPPRRRSAKHVPKKKGRRA